MTLLHKAAILFALILIVSAWAGFGGQGLSDHTKLLSRILCGMSGVLELVLLWALFGSRKPKEGA